MPLSLPSVVPPEAPRVVQQAVVAVLTVPLILVIAMIVGLITGAQGGVIALDVVLIVLFATLAREIGRARQWARFATVGISALLLLGSVGNIVLGGFLAIIGVVFLLLYAGIIWLLLTGTASSWFSRR